MQYLLLLLILSLAGCNRNQVINAPDGAHNISCEGLEKTIGTNVVILVGKNIIKYYGKDGESFIAGATKYMID